MSVQRVEEMNVRVEAGEKEMTGRYTVDRCPTSEVK